MIYKVRHLTTYTYEKPVSFARCALRLAAHPGDGQTVLESVVTLTLTPTAGGTRLRMEQEGFRPDQKQAFGGAHAGWKQFLDKLEGLLAKEG